MMRTGSGLIDAEYAFTRARRASRRAALARALHLGSVERRLAVYCSSGRPRRAGQHGLREIPLAAIAGTLEPTRAAQFDGAFRPVTRSARRRWERIWLAEDHGTILPPISVVPVGEHSFAVVDGHHRVSVAHARGAVAIDATVDAR
ncbi:ParB/RepB/Spo0J family partition protein [Solirubrobacter ginsenosidimutans]|uniref:ParB/RepB/Spo0J family partition protein n=1 Tax=Solirubrobacter ginsenosidimutans TaxID=490573 RepID=A0A9X3S2H1_9ACTN|nr:ParB N-terminal domain-containing protein [Solirubrobacter ginsenosidimutans]MDA0161131.1 ParB/RepB/Spo0J family partition protein [Solirubrobacter ginsenosidimutans]